MPGKGDPRRWGKWDAAHREYRAAAQRRRRPERHGITQDQYDQMVDAQGNLCAICWEPADGQTLAIDHDHGNCNRGIGFLGDDPQVLLSAASYLLAHRRA